MNNACASFFIIINYAPRSMSRGFLYFPVLYAHKHPPSAPKTIKPDGIIHTPSGFYLLLITYSLFTIHFSLFTFTYYLFPFFHSFHRKRSTLPLRGRLSPLPLHSSLLPLTFLALLPPQADCPSQNIIASCTSTLCLHSVLTLIILVTHLTN